MSAASERERDACGIGFVARLDAVPKHGVVQAALRALASQAHRGALAADGKTGDGAGLLTGLPYAFMAREFERLEKTSAPSPEDFALGVVFFPPSTQERLARGRALVAACVAAEGLEALGWRVVPIDRSVLGEHGLASCPHIEQLFVGRGAGIARGDAFETALYRARKRVRKQAIEAGLEELYLPSLSHRTIVYKGLLMAPALARFYPDLEDPLYRSAFALFHQRYSTNTRPSWRLAQPFRLLCHNGEINTLEGNVAWMRAREAAYREQIWGEEYDKFFSLVDRRGSDSAIFDNALELFVRMGYDLRHALLMMAPPAWERSAETEIPGAWRAFYRYHESLLEPWDGPAAIAFADGRHVGICLDRNGLRPARYAVCTDGLVLAASEAGALPIDPTRTAAQGMLGAGDMIACDLEQGTLLSSEQIKDLFAHMEPYGSLVARRFRPVRPNPGVRLARDARFEKDALDRRKIAFGFRHEDEVVLLRPMLMRGREPVGSMGDDTPLAVLSRFGRPLFDFFVQRFAQVTNPPIDPIREEIVMSLRTCLGQRGNVLNPNDEKIRMLELPGPVLDPAQFAQINALSADPAFRVKTIDTTWPVADGARGLERAIERVLEEAAAAVEAGHTLLILSDRAIGPGRTMIPSLLVSAALHQHLVQSGLRLRTSLIVDSGEPREVHHLACLIGFGADALHPYLLYAALDTMIAQGGRHTEGLRPSEAIERLISALHKGLLKIMSKMGIALVASYRGAQIFESIGLDPAFCARYFPTLRNAPGGYGLEQIAATLTRWHAAAFGSDPEAETAKSGALPSIGLYKYRRGGEPHAFSPEVVRALHRAVGLSAKRPRAEQRPSPPPAGNGPSPAWLEYSRLVHARAPIFPRDLLELVPAGKPLPISEVEPAERIVARLSTGAMSHGALSAEAHETLAEALNRIGAMSNAGEGGEAPERYGTSRNSAIKQVASGRFGVTACYLASAKELQIKIAQGAKPGEGGQLPGHKVTDEIARNRHTTPGVALISPPPHHDIYSIEDLAELIYDLKQANPEACVSVKLVATSGIGQIACGVVKGYADVVHVSGASGGTGASPLSSIRHAGMPWEYGLAETARALIENGLRDRVRLRVDGTFQTGRDVLIAAALGADEYSFGTAALIAEGCIMARTCHTNNCPVGVASQRRALRDRFPGLAEHVISFMLELAEEVRARLASLGLRNLEALIGRTERLRPRPQADPGRALDVSALLWRPPAALPRRALTPPREPLRPPSTDIPLGERIAREALEALERGERNVVLGDPEPIPIATPERAVGARLAFHIARSYGPRGLGARGRRVRIRMRGAAGQSFGAFLPYGVRLELEGVANDYVGKGLSGGEIVLRPPATAPYAAKRHVIAGNTVLYGATAGRLFAAGAAGQRLCVRNSGALAVFEGAGDHCCEYMTGGVAVVLGPVGRNFGAGMTGGVAYVYDEDERLPERLNDELVEALRLTDPRHEEELLGFIEAHLQATGSARARSLLDRWDEIYVRFWRVAPRGAVAGIEKGNEGAEEAKRRTRSA